MSADAAEQANERLVDRMIVEGALWSLPLIQAFRATPRHGFLDRVFQHSRESSEGWEERIVREPGPEELAIVYSDRALITRLSDAAPDGLPRVPISSSSQPSLMAEMLEDLNLAPGLRVLEIGAGTGYNAALMAHVVGRGNVLSFDVDQSVLSEAWDHLRKFPKRDVCLRHADGRVKVPDERPFDRIIVTAATPDLEPAWLEQLNPGGLLEAPVEFAPGLAFVVVGSLGKAGLEARLTRAAYFMPLRDEGKSGEDLAGNELPASGQREIAPWAGWFERRRPHQGWSGFVQALAFFGWLRGLRASFQSRDDGGLFGVADVEGNACWFGSHDWVLVGPGARALGDRVYRAFLDAGGPRPWEFRLRVSLHEVPPAAAAVSFVRRGPRFWQRWDLPEPRRRGSES